MKEARSGHTYAYKKKQIKNYIRKIMIGRMVAYNIQDLIDNVFQINVDNYGDISIEPKEEYHSVITLLDITKQTRKISRALNIEPSKDMSEHYVSVNYYLYFNLHDSQTIGVNIYMSTRNNEPCEITYKRKMHKVPVYTGFCKEFMEEKVLS